MTCSACTSPVLAKGLCSTHYQRKRRIEKPREQPAASSKRRIHYRDVLGLVKTTAGCADCGYDSHPAALDFDHLPGADKAFHLAHGSKYSWATVWAEVAKCEVVCANCHRIRTTSRGG